VLFITWQMAVLEYNENSYQSEKHAMYVCICNSVTDKAIHKAVAGGVRTFAELQEQTAVSTCCGQCTGCAKQVMADALSAQPVPQAIRWMPQRMVSA
jgi:bacterioferritin-associated ferredoxin